jgi:TP901 family phage tail tape measure protein
LLITAPIIAGLGTGISQAINFESAFAEVKKTVNATEAEWARYRQQVIEIARVMPFAREQIASVMAAAGRFGVANDDLAKFTETALKLGTATGQAPEVVAEQVSRLMNLIQVAPQDMEKFLSSIVALGNDIPTTEANIISMALRIGQIRAVANASPADINGMAAALSALGIRAEMGGSALSRVFFNISDLVKTGGDDLEAFADQFGFVAEDFAAKFEADPTAAVTDFLTAVRRLSDEGANVPAILKEFGLGEIRVRDTILRASQGIDTWNKALAISNKGFEQGTALQIEYEKRLETTESRWIMFKNRLSEVALVFGTALLPIMIDVLDALMPFVEMLGAAAQAFSMLDPEVRKTVVTLALMAAAIGPVLFIGTKLIAMFSNIGLAFIAMTRLIMAHPIILALALIALAAYEIITHWEEVKTFFKNLWDDVTGFAQKAWDTINEIWSTAFTGDFLGVGPWEEDEWFPNALLTFHDKWTTYWEDISNIAVGSWQGNVDGWVGLWEDITGATTTGANGVKTGWNATWGFVSEQFHHWVDPLADTFLVLWDEFGLDTGAGGAGVSRLIGEFGNATQLAFGTMKDVVTLLWDEQWSFIKLTAENSVNELKILWANMGIAWGLVWPLMRTAAEVAWFAIRDNVFVPMVDFWMPRIKAAMDLTGEAWSFWWPVIQSVVNTAWSLILGYFTAMAGWLQTLGSFMLDLWSIFDRTWQAMPQIVKTAIEQIKTHLRGLKDAAQDALGPLSQVLSYATGGQGLVPNFIPIAGRADDGGIVPGLRGSPQLILAHGGEELIPKHKPGWQDAAQVVERHVHFHLDGPISVRSDQDILDMRRAFYEQERSEAFAKGESVVA